MAHVNFEKGGAPLAIQVGGQEIVSETRELHDVTAPAAIIADGTFHVDRIPSLPASKIGSGELDDGRVKASNVTQHQAALQIHTSQLSDGVLGIARGGTGLGTLGIPGQIPVVNSGGDGLEYQDAAGGGGKVLQVVSAAGTGSPTSSSGTYASANVAASITPAFATSKILVIAVRNFYMSWGSGGSGFQVSLKTRLVRTSTGIAEMDPAGLILGDLTGGAGIDDMVNADSVTMICLDSPNTTSSTTYTLQFARSAGNGAIATQNNQGYIILMEIGA